MQRTRFTLEVNKRPSEASWQESQSSPAENPFGYALGEKVFLNVTGPGLRIAKNGSRWLIAIGRFNTQTATSHLDSILCGIRNPRDMLNKARLMAGSFHLIYSDPEETIVQGPASGSRQTFFHEDDERLLIGNRAHDISSDNKRSHPNYEFITLGLIYPLVDYGLTRDTHWTHVKRLLAQERIGWSKAHGTWVETYWKPPKRDQPLDETAEALRAELVKSLSTVANDRQSVTADFSGGMDSTSLCCLMSTMNVPYRGYVEQVDDPDHSDAEWAQRVANSIGADLHIIRPEDFPRPYQDIVSDTGQLNSTTDALTHDAPCTIIRNLGRAEASAKLFRFHGSNTHLGGFGADELFTTAPSALSDLYQTHPLRTLAEARPLAQLRRWKYRDVFKQLRRADDYNAWLDYNLTDFKEPSSDHHAPIPLNWGPDLTAPPWLTEKAQRIARDHLLDNRARWNPQADDRATHTALVGQRLGGIRLEPLQDIFAAEGISLSFPYMDDNVMETAISLRLHDTMPGHGFKPLLKEAMRPVRNGNLTRRTTKGEFSNWVSTGLSGERNRLAKIFSNSALADLGYINPQAMQDSIFDQLRPARHTTMIELTLGAEVWLRRLPES